MKTNAMINLRNIIVIILLATLSASNVSISSADSVPALPNTFSGTVKFVNSSGQFDAPAGTLIEALIDNVTKGANVTVGSRYNIDVYGTNDDDGKDIIFKANNLTAEQKSIFSASYPSPQTLNLIVNLTEQADVPSSLSIVINNGNEYTNSTAVILSLSAANAEQMSFSNDSVSWSSWEPYTTTKSWSLISEDGLKTVYFKAKNFAGEALPVNDTIILDTTPPTVQITSPANGTIVGTSNINVTGTATDSSRIKGGSIEQQSELVGGGGGLGIINSTSIAFEYNIALQEGKNSIKITYIDIANNSGSASVNVTLDTTPPGSVTNLVNTSYAGTYINWTWTDPSDMDFSKAMVYVDGMLQTNVSKGVQFYSATGFSPGTQHTIATQTVDTIGNINQTWFNHTARTEPAPSSLSIVINNGDNYTNLTSVALSLSAVDAEQMSFSNDSISWSPWENYTTTKLWKLISGDGSKTVYFKAKNGIIEVAPVNDTITLDTIPPEVNISDPVQNKTLKYFENIVKGTFSDNNIQSATLTVKNETTLWSREYSLNLTPDSNGYKFTERVEFAGDQNNTIELFALDKAGNTNVASVAVLVKNNTYVNETNVTKGNATIIDAKNESDTEIEFIPNVTTNVTFTITATTNETMIENVTNSSSKFGEVALGKIVEVNVTGLNATNKSEVQSVTIKLFVFVKLTQHIIPF